MALGGLDVVVKFIGDASSVQNEVAKVEGTSGKLKSWAKGIGAAIGTAFVVDQMKNFVSAAEEADVASNRLAQTLKNVGDASGAWAKKAEELATSLMNKTGVDDEVIKGGRRSSPRSIPCPTPPRNRTGRSRRRRNCHSISPRPGSGTWTPVRRRSARHSRIR